MKLKRITLLVLVLALLGTFALAEAALDARLESGCLKVDWRGGTGECTLTLYMDGWPAEVLRVQPSGSLERAVEGGHSYMARLNMSGGCLTADAGKAAPTAVPTAIPTPEPTAVPTPEPTAIPTVLPTSAPTPIPTVQPTPIPTVRPTAVPTPTPVAGTNLGDLASQVVAQVNQEREKQGLGALRVDGELTRAAQVRAREIVTRFSHTRPDGSAWSTVSGSAYGENIAMGQQTADKVMAAWMTSQGHRENILRPGFGSIGVCALRVDGVMYWVQLFGK